ncbi:AraC family transcriptional regulator [Microbispora rosea subsp. aerata]|nr:helix-turn-helix transcriptional regulator [Microbispora rosea]GGO11091.1 AraC family transcriptional regulator [Microbispora rosea subsp. aerata]GIH53584.1 AraC family transcriptional regulator [Microbispora rosea subsp. aerata]GLJ86285.1 AraC family transcriptional regulator [Microbispora rosea subsp. aerata]
MYRERVSGVPDAVLWWSTSPAAGSAERRVLPDGCMDVIWADGTLLVAGPDTTAHLVLDRPGARYVGLRFGPGVGPLVFGVPAYELRDRRVPLADVWPGAQARLLAERAGEAAELGGPVGVVLEEAAARRLRDAPRLVDADLVRAVVDGVRAGVPVGRIAAGAGVGERRLHRRCLEAFGYGPRTLGRILRMNRALALARGGMPFAEVAAVAGYADQAHLSREVRSLTGVTLGTLIR